MTSQLWDQLQLDTFWAERLPQSRKGRKWLNVLKTLVSCRLISPGSEWRLHREWFRNSAMADLLGEDERLVQKDKLYRCLDKPWNQVRCEVKVKLLRQNGEFYILARSDGRVNKERSMRIRRLKKLWRRLRELQSQHITRDTLLLKIGAAKKEAGRVYSLIKINLPKQDAPVNHDTFTFSLKKDKLRSVRRREGCYLLRSNLTSTDPAMLWQQYIQLTEIEQAFKELKGDLSIRPIHHQSDERIEAHIFVAFMAYCLLVTLKHRARQLGPGFTPRSILEKFSTMQMVDVHLPTTDGRYLILPRYTQPDEDMKLLLAHLNLLLPAQPPPRIGSGKMTSKEAV